MITEEVILKLIKLGRPFEVTPDGGLIVQGPSKASRKEQNRRAYEARKAAKDSAQIHTETAESALKPTENAELDAPSSPSPSPSFPLSLSSPEPPSLPLTHTPPSAPPPVREWGAAGELGLGLLDAEPKMKKKRQAYPQTPNQIRVGSWFGRMHSTPWKPTEITAWNSLGELRAEDLDTMEAYYTAPDEQVKYRRRKLETLLNNWHDELYAARKFKPSPADDRIF